nr:hypothetical protein HmN_000134000 [Hymenolepis microstoma]
MGFECSSAVDHGHDNSSLVNRGSDSNRHSNASSSEFVSRPGFVHHLNSYHGDDTVSTEANIGGLKTRKGDFSDLG